MMSELRKYGVLLTTAKAIQFTLYQVDGVDIEPAATFAAGDIKISKDGGAEANATNLPTDEGQGYRLILTAAELTASRIRLFIVDQTATKVWLDIEINIETYGNASAMHAFDLNDDVRPDLDAIAIALTIMAGADGVRLATLQGNYAPAKAGDNMGAVSSVTGNVDGSVASVTAINTTAGAIDNVAIVAITTTNTDMRGTNGANTTVPDAAGVAPTAVEIRQEMDTNSVDLNSIITTLGTAGAGLTDLGGMSTGMKAEVNAEVVDTLNVDAYTEPGQGAPAATTSLVAKINYLYKAWRNKTEQTATTLSVYNDAGTVVDQKATVSDSGTTATNGEIVSGP